MYFSLTDSKVVVQLKGGLGNQLFQFAAGYAAARVFSRRLYLDRHTGFRRDRQYRRTNHIPSAWAPEANVIDRIIFDTCSHKYFAPVRQVIDISNLGILVEDNQEHLYDLSGTQQILRLSGYWQSPKYFEAEASQLTFLFSQQPTMSHEVRVLGEKMRSEEALAICIRQYEESKDPLSHSRYRRQIALADILRAYERFLRFRKAPKIYVFSTVATGLATQVVEALDAHLVLPAIDDINPWVTLWLLRQPAHHIITNSSLYWWAAYLRARETESGLTLASDNFINPLALPTSWLRF